MTTDILINITTEVIRSKHISWTTKEEDNYIILYEIVENYYEHPDSEGNALIQKLEMVECERVMKTDTLNAAPLFQLINSLNTINLIHDKD